MGGSILSDLLAGRNWQTLGAKWLRGRSMPPPLADHLHVRWSDAQGLTCEVLRSLAGHVLGEIEAEGQTVSSWPRNGT